MKFLLKIFKPCSTNSLELAWFFLRISIGILTILHGIPKIGGFKVWHNLGVTFMYPLGIRFLPTLWGFLGAATEFLGGIFFTIGLGTRIASFCLTIMMVIATSWHLIQGDDFNKYSFPLSLFFVYLNYMFFGSGKISLDEHVTKNKI